MNVFVSSVMFVVCSYRIQLTFAFEKNRLSDASMSIPSLNNKTKDTFAFEYKLGMIIEMNK